MEVPDPRRLIREEQHAAVVEGASRGVRDGVGLVVPRVEIASERPRRLARGIGPREEDVVGAAPDELVRVARGAHARRSHVEPHHELLEVGADLRVRVDRDDANAVVSGAEALERDRDRLGRSEGASRRARRDAAGRHVVAAHAREGAIPGHDDLVAREVPRGAARVRGRLDRGRRHHGDDARVHACVRERRAVERGVQRRARGAARGEDAEIVGAEDARGRAHAAAEAQRAEGLEEHAGAARDRAGDVGRLVHTDAERRSRSECDARAGRDAKAARADRERLSRRHAELAAEIEIDAARVDVRTREIQHRAGQRELGLDADAVLAAHRAALRARPARAARRADLTARAVAARLARRARARAEARGAALATHGVEEPRRALAVAALHGAPVAAHRAGRAHRGHVHALAHAAGERAARVGDECARGAPLHARHTTSSRAFGARRERVGRREPGVHGRVGELHATAVDVGVGEHGHRGVGACVGEGEAAAIDVSVGRGRKGCVCGAGIDTRAIALTGLVAPRATGLDTRRAAWARAGDGHAIDAARASAAARERCAREREEGHEGEGRGRDARGREDRRVRG